MRTSRLAVVGSALLSLIALRAFAGGYNITYGTGCWLETPASSWTFACDSNTGAVPVTISCTFDSPIPDLLGCQVRVDGQALGLMPDWWQLGGTTLCRSGSLHASADFSLAPQAACADLNGGLAVAGVSDYWTALNYPYYFSPRRFAMWAYTSLPVPVAAQAGVEYYMCRLTIAYTRSVGADACAGCTTPLTMALLSVVAYRSGGGRYSVDRPHENWCLTWQNGAPPCTTVPAYNVTWGQVKSLYR